MKKQDHSYRNKEYIPKEIYTFRIFKDGTCSLEIQGAGLLQATLSLKNIQNNFPSLVKEALDSMVARRNSEVPLPCKECGEPQSESNGTCEYCNAPD